MSLLKKMGAVALGTVTATGWLATQAAKAACDAAAEKLGNGSFTAKDGRTITGSDCRNMAQKCNEKLHGVRDGNGNIEKESIFKKGFDISKKLWQDEN